ncbi:MAG: XrtA/PEP-CTERM system TPR-repeat protein PrsT [Parahaliea sp.]
MKYPSKHLLAIAVAVLLTACSAEVSDTEYMQRAQAHLLSGDHKSALIELKNAVRKNPVNFDARLQLGELQFKAYDYNSAEKELTRVLERTESDNEKRNIILPMLARTWLGLGRFNDILAIDDTGLSDDSRAAILAAKAVVQLQENARIQGEELLSEALILDPDGVYLQYAKALYLASGGDPVAARDISLAVVDQDAGIAEAWALLGDLSVPAGGGESEAAPEYYTKAIKLNPFSALYRLKQAYAYIRIRDFDAAKKELEFLQKTAPQEPQVNYGLGIIEYHAGEYESALSSLLIAEPARFDTPGVLLYLGMTQAALGDYEAAYRYTQDYYAIDTENVLANRLMATLWLRFGEAEKSEQLVRSMLKKAPGQIDLLNMLANSLVAQQRMDEALTVLTEVSELDPESAAAKARLGAGYLNAGRQQEGFDLVREAIAAAPEEGSADALLVMSYLESKDIDAAFEAAEAYRKRAPKDVAPYLLLGRVNLAKGDREAARKSFAHAISIESDNAAANHSLASLSLSEQDLAAARTYYNAVLAKRPDYLPSLMALAAVDAIDNKTDSMVATLEQAIGSNPRAVPPRVVLARYYLSTKQADKVIDLFTSLGDEAVRNKQIQRLRALAYIQLGEYSAARDAVSIAISQGVAEPPEYQLLAQAWEGIGDMEQVGKALSQAQAIDAKNPQIALSMAKLAYTKGDRATMEKNLKIAAAALPDNMDVVQLKAASAQLDGKNDDALALLEEQYAKSPIEPVLLNLVKQYQRMGKSSEAIDVLGHWLEKNPDKNLARLTLATQYQLAGDDEQAVREFSRVLENDDGNVVALNNLGWLLRFSDNKRALDYSRRATALLPDVPALEDTLAMVLSAKGEYEQAFDILNKLIEKNPDDKSLRFHRAQVNVAVGNKKKARAEISRLLADNTSFPEREEAKVLLNTL